MVNQVVAGEGIDELAPAFEVRSRDGNNLSVSTSRRDILRPNESLRVALQHSGQRDHDGVIDRVCLSHDPLD